MCVAEEAPRLVCEVRAFLRERTVHHEYAKRYGYTRRKLRGVHSLRLTREHDLFSYTRLPEVPRTTNHVESGINSRTKNLYRIHQIIGQ